VYLSGGGSLARKRKKKLGKAGSGSETLTHPNRKGGILRRDSQNQQKEEKRAAKKVTIHDSSPFDLRTKKDQSTEGNNDARMQKKGKIHVPGRTASHLQRGGKFFSFSKSVKRGERGSPLRRERSLGEKPGFFIGEKSSIIDKDKPESDLLGKDGAIMNSKGKGRRCGYGGGMTRTYLTK